MQNNTTEFLIFMQQGDKNGIEARYEDGIIWLTQKLMAELFAVNTNTVGEHLQNIFKSDELDQNSVTRKFQATAVGYRVNSKRATHFRQWATQVLHQLAIRGYVLDRKRLENGSFYLFIMRPGADSNRRPAP